MKTRLSYLVLLLFVAALVGCKGSKAGKSVYKTLDTKTQEMVDKWKNDPVGCKKERNGPLADALLAAFHKSEYTEEQISGLLGEPEQKAVNGNTRIIGYYWDTTCVDGKMKDSSVYCLLQFFLDNTTGKIESGGVVCG